MREVTKQVIEIKRDRATNMICQSD